MQNILQFHQAMFQLFCYLQLASIRDFMTELNVWHPFTMNTKLLIFIDLLILVHYKK